MKRCGHPERYGGRRKYLPKAERNTDQELGCIPMERDKYCLYSESEKQKLLFFVFFFNEEKGINKNILRWNNCKHVIMFEFDQCSCAQETGSD